MNLDFLKTGKAKLVAVSLSVALVLCALVGGTFAWLVTQTAPVVNTFTYGDIQITLTETDYDGDGNPNTNSYPMVPGRTVTKDPVVTVLADSEDCWLFVKLEKSANFDTFMEYAMVLDDAATAEVEGWTALDGVDGVYYREVAKKDTDAEFSVIKDDAVTVKSTVTKEMLNALDTNADGTAKNEAEYPTLTITAYAVQQDVSITDAAAAWAKFA